MRLFLSINLGETGLKMIQDLRISLVFISLPLLVTCICNYGLAIYAKYRG
jgi:hypothetical protein